MAAGGQVGGGGEVGAVAGVGGRACQADREVGFAGARRADEQDVRRGFEVSAGAQFVDQRAVDAGGGVDVKVGEGGRGGQAGVSFQLCKSGVVHHRTAVWAGRRSVL